MSDSLKSNVDIIAYPFGKSAGKDNSGDTPFVVEKILSPALKSLGLINDFVTVRTPEIKKEESFVKGLVRNGDKVLEAVTSLSDSIAATLWQGRKPLVLGGDHSQGCATSKATMLVEVLKGIRSGEANLSDEYKNKIISLANDGNFRGASEIIGQRYKADKNFKNAVDKIVSNTAIVWLDTHGDYNDPTISSSGNFHGQSLRAVVKGAPVGKFSEIYGDFLRADPKNVYVVGHRDLDPEEIDAMKKDGVNFLDYSMVEGYGSASEQKFDVKIRAFGKAIRDGMKSFADTVDEITAKLKAEGKKIVFSYDIDVNHGKFTAGTGTPQGLKLGDIIPLSRVMIEQEMIRPNAENRSPDGPAPYDSYRAISSAVHKYGGADLTEISCYISYEKNGRRFYEPDYAGLLTGMKSLIAMLAPENEKLFGIKTNNNELPLFKRVAREVERLFPQYRESDGKFNFRKLADDTIKPILAKRVVADKTMSL